MNAGACGLYSNEDRWNEKNYQPGQSRSRAWRVAAPEGRGNKKNKKADQVNDLSARQT